jgi:hypothetical protein
MKHGGMNLDIREILKEVGIAAAFDGIKDIIKGAKDKAVEEVKKSNKEVRAEFFAFISKLGNLDPDAKKGLLEAQSSRQRGEKKPYRCAKEPKYLPGSENKLMIVLTDLYKGLQEKEEESVRLQVFQELGHLYIDNPKEFDSRIEALDDDKIMQFIKLIGIRAKQFTDKYGPELVPGLEKIAIKANETAGKAAEGVSGLRRFIRNL